MTRWLPFLLMLTLVVTVVYAADTRLCPRFFHWVAAVPHLDKGLHFVLMGMLAWVANIALRHHRLRLGSFRLLTGSLAVFLIVAVEEYSQRWFPARSCDTWDLLADALGIGCASLLSPDVLHEKQML